METTETYVYGIKLPQTKAAQEIERQKKITYRIDCPIKNDRTFPSDSLMAKLHPHGYNRLW